ncbi:MAG: diphosphomevalonate decarboxylase [Pseudomonadota bacterium]
MTDQPEQISRASAHAHPNIALVKYWGKADTGRNLPATGSLSLTLGALQTHTTVARGASDTLTVNGDSRPEMAERLFRFLDSAFPDRPALSIDTQNDFPTAAGLASSASGFAAVVCAVDGLLQSGHSEHRLAQLAGGGSGSAARSLYGGIVRLDAPATENDDIRLRPLAEPADWPLEVLVAVIDEGPKAVGSTEGMERTRTTSPYYSGWIDSHARDLDLATDAVGKRDFAALADVTEHSFFKMHAVMMSSQPALLYWLPASVGVVRLVADLRARGVPACCTMDAGPQVKVVTTPDAATELASAITGVAGVQRVIRSGLGNAPVVNLER